MRTVSFCLAVFIAILFSSLRVKAQSEPVSVNDSITVSLITCYPGPEIYELCGHSAIRIRGAEIDSVWNFGTFDFREPNFVYRFVKGETDYMLSSYPFEYFLPGYFAQNRTIFEQDLNLSQEEARRLHKMLQTEALPQNSKYRYNYVKDNCATRIILRLDQAADKQIVYPDSIAYGTFRKAMRSYHKNYPWYQFGIDLALGSGIDSKIDSRAEMFAPLELMKKTSAAHFADGSPLVADSRIIFQGADSATLPPTPFWFSPFFISCIILVICLIIAVVDYKKQILIKWVYTLYFLILGLGGLLITFLVFCSQHESTSPNILILWLNPLQLILALGVWSRKMRYINLAVAFYNVSVISLMILVWAFQKQSANPAFFPLMASTIALSVGYIFYFNQKLKNQNATVSYNRTNSSKPKRNTRRKIK